MSGIHQRLNDLIQLNYSICAIWSLPLAYWEKLWFISMIDSIKKLTVIIGCGSIFITSLLAADYFVSQGRINSTTVPSNWYRSAMQWQSQHLLNIYEFIRHGHCWFDDNPILCKCRIAVDCDVCNSNGEKSSLWLR